MAIGKERNKMRYSSRMGRMVEDKRKGGGNQFLNEAGEKTSNGMVSGRGGAGPRPVPSRDGTERDETRRDETGRDATRQDGTGSDQAS